MVLVDPELMAMRYHLLASFLVCQYGNNDPGGVRTYISFLTPLPPFDNKKPSSESQCLL